VNEIRPTPPARGILLIVVVAFVAILALVAATAADDGVAYDDGTGLTSGVSEDGESANGRSGVGVGEAGTPGRSGAVVRSDGGTVVFSDDGGSITTSDGGTVIFSDTLPDGTDVTFSSG
jgi:hypothetical protein